MLLLLSLLFPQPARAYVPPSFFIVRKLAHKHASLEEGRIRSKVVVYGSNGQVAHTLTEVVAISGPEKAVIRLADENEAELATHARKLSDAKGAGEGDLGRPVLYDLLMVRDGASIFEHLRALGLPLRTEADLYSEKEGALPYKPEDTVALARYENRFAVVVGDPPPKSASDTKGAQLWVEKDSFLPLRAVFPTAPEAGAASQPLEFRFSGYQVYKSLLYPKATQVFRDGTLWLRIETLDVRVGPVSALEPAKTKTEPSGELKEFFEKYFKWVR